MDPITLAAGSALVGAMATDAWQQARGAVVELWRRVHPERADAVGRELETARAQVLAARREGDTDTEEALAGAWRLQLQQLLAQDPELVGELQRLLDEHLTPSLPQGEQTHIRTIIMNAEARDNSRVYMAARDQNFNTEERPHG
jgi:hypothetical protein